MQPKSLIEVRYYIQTDISWPLSLLLPHTMFHLFHFYFLYLSLHIPEPHSFFSSPLSSFSFASSCLAPRQKSIWLQFQTSRKVDRCFVKVMLMPWQLLIWWFIAAKHMYMGARACVIGPARSSCQIYLPHPFHDEKKISYLIDCTAFNGVHVHGWNT